jgi:hypothetical protein
MSPRRVEPRPVVVGAKSRTGSVGAERIVCSSPYTEVPNGVCRKTTEGTPYGRRPINLDQPDEFIAQEVAARFRAGLLEFNYEKITNSLFIKLTDGRLFRIYYR